MPVKLMLTEWISGGMKLLDADILLEIVGYVMAAPQAASIIAAAAVVASSDAATAVALTIVLLPQMIGHLHSCHLRLFIMHCSGQRQHLKQELQATLAVDVALSNFDVAGPNFNNLRLAKRVDGKVGFCWRCLEDRLRCLHSLWLKQCVLRYQAV
jgi:hypothetical protein